MSKAGVLLRDYACAQLARGRACLAWRGTHTHEGVHQARKSMRRARACIALASLERERAGGRLDRELAGLCRGLSDLRDAQARIETLDRILLDPEARDIAALLRRVRRLAAVERADALRSARALDPDFRQRRERLHALATELVALDWTDIGSAAIEVAVGRGLKRCRKAESRALDGGTAADWHRWRRRRRRVLQQHDALKACAIDARHDEHPQRDLSRYLGESQDLAVLIAHFGMHPRLAKTERQALLTGLDAALTRKNAEVAAVLKRHEG